MDNIAIINEKLQKALKPLREREINSFLARAQKDFDAIVSSEKPFDALEKSWVRPSVIQIDGTIRLDIQALRTGIEHMVDRYLEQFRSKTLLKVKTIIRFRPDASIMIRSLEVGADGPRGVIEVRYQDGDHFQLRSSMVWVYEASGKEPFCRFPSTFHGIKLKGKKYQKKPHAWMVLVFTGNISDAEYERKEEKGELDSLFRRLVLGKSEEDVMREKGGGNGEAKKLSFIEPPVTAPKVIMSFDEDE